MSSSLRSSCSKKQYSPKNYHYLIYGNCVCSDIPLGLCETKVRNSPGVSIKRRKKGVPFKPAWFHMVHDRFGDKICGFGRNNSDFILRFFGRGDFFLSKNRRAIRYSLQTKTDLSVLQALLLTQVFPLFLSLYGRPILHGSVVKIGRKTIVFLGPQGRGKSTLAAAFIKKRFFVLSDDAVPLISKKEQIWGVPSFPEIRLESSTLKAILGAPLALNTLPAIKKRRATIADVFWSKPSKITNVFLLERGRVPMIEDASLEKKWQALVSNSFRVELYSRKRMRNEIQFFSDLLDKSVIKTLIYPRELKQLNKVVDLVLREVANS